MILNKLNMQTLASKTAGEVAKAIESQTAKVPSDYSLWFGLGALGVSFLLRATKFKPIGVAIGQAAAPLVVMGLYKKLAKRHGNEIQDKISAPKEYLPDLG